jgi:hypothetical protein
MRKTSLSVLLTQSSDVPATGSYFGAPVSRISSAGVVLTNTFGVLLAESFWPGSAAFTSLQLSSLGSFLKLSGKVPAGPHGPASSVAFSHARHGLPSSPYWPPANGGIGAQHDPPVYRQSGARPRAGSGRSPARAREERPGPGGEAETASGFRHRSSP